MLATTAGDVMSMPRTAVPEIDTFLRYKDTDDPQLQKAYTDFRDRAAYVYVTGSFPTHLRSFFTSLLRKATRHASKPVALDQRSGSIQITPQVVKQLQLDNHPMVEQVRNYLKHGFKIQASRGVTERRPYSRVFMFREAPMGRGVAKITVQIDGSMKEGWQ